MKRVFQVFIAVLFLGASMAHAHDYDVGTLNIDHPWSRATVAGIPNGVAYFGLKNTGDQDDRLVSASTPVADRAELHNHVVDGEVVRMRHVDNIEIPAGGSVALEPSGLHVMLMGLKQPLKEGETFELTLEFEHAGTTTVDVMVQGMGKSKADHGDMDHSHHH